MDQEQPTVLIVEDDDQLAELLLEYLAPHGFAIARVSSGNAGARRILDTQPDLVILDLMLPGASGLDVCRQVRSGYSGAILILTASQSDADHVAALELGADDFVTKPIEPRVLLARIRTQLRRLQGRRVPHPGRVDGIVDGVVDLGRLRVNVPSRRVQVDGTPVPLTTMEFDILAMLAKEAGTVVTRDDLYTRVIGTEYDGIDRGLDVHVSRIRRKLNSASFDTTRLKSVRGVGYLLASQ